MKTINDIIKIIRTENCNRKTVCVYCKGYDFCAVDTMFIALDYIKREGII